MISPYRAPEINEHDSYVQSDLFSWAAILCELLTGRTDAEKLHSVVSNKKDYPALAPVPRRALPPSSDDGGQGARAVERLEGVAMAAVTNELSQIDVRERLVFSLQAFGPEKESAKASSGK